MGYTISRNFSSTIYNYISSGLKRDGWNSVKVYDAYPNKLTTGSGLPAVSIEFGNNTNVPLQLGGGLIESYFIIVNVFAGFKGEKEDLSHVIKSYFESSTPFNDCSNPAVPVSMGRTVYFEEVTQYPSPMDSQAVDEAYKHNQIITCVGNVTKAIGE